MTFDFSQITEVQLSSGSHKFPEDGMCAMEMVAWFNGEKHSAYPQCSCPVLGSFTMFFNDRMPDRLRDPLLKPFIPRLVGTRSTKHELVRAEIIYEHAANVPRANTDLLSSIRDEINAGRADYIGSPAARIFYFQDAWGRGQKALDAAIKAGPQGDFAHDPVERYEALKQLVSA